MSPIINYPPNTKKGPDGPVFVMARPERFELPTTWFEARYSIQLSYGREQEKASCLGALGPPFCCG